MQYIYIYKIRKNFKCAWLNCSHFFYLKLILKVFDVNFVV